MYHPPSREVMPGRVGGDACVWIRVLLGPAGPFTQRKLIEGGYLREGNRMKMAGYLPRQYPKKGERHFQS